MTPSPAVGRGWRRPWLWAWLAFLPFALLRSGTLGETDTFWQIRTGLLTLEQQAIPAVDSFSWTMSGAPWTLNSWAFNVLLGLAYRVAGLPGAALACAVLSMAAGGLVLVLARQLGASAAVAGTFLWVGSPLLIAWLSARPQLIDYVAVLTLVVLLRRIVHAEHRMWSILLVGLLCVVWVNLHSAALLGVAITGASWVMQFVWTSGRASAQWYLAATAAAAAGSLLNPLGIDLILKAVNVTGASSGVIVEWQNLNPADPVQLTSFVLGLLALALAIRRRDPVMAGALSVAAVAGLFAIRFLPVLLLLSLPIIAASCSGPAVIRYIESRRTLLVAGASVAVCSVLALAIPAMTHIGQPLPETYPVRAVAAIPAGCRLYNSYLLGGSVILERPDVLVSVDSRNDLYGAARITAAERTLQGRGDVSSDLASVGCVLVPPTSGLAGMLSRDPAWREETREVSAVLFVRRA